MFPTRKKKYVSTQIYTDLYNVFLTAGCGQKSVKGTDPNGVSVSEKCPAPYFQVADRGASMPCLY